MGAGKKINCSFNIGVNLGSGFLNYREFVNCEKFNICLPLINVIV